MVQNTPHLFLVRPSSFGYNLETAVNNAFQTLDPSMKEEEIRRQATEEFDEFVSILESNDLDIWVFQDPLTPVTPDAVFPNNWISFHADGTMITYPMFAPSRRLERHPKAIQLIENHFEVRQRLSLEEAEEKGQFLEGTGSIVFDHVHKLAYASTSPRTHPELLHSFCKTIGYQPVLFRATDVSHAPIYHTNVMMSVGEQFVVICPNVVRDDAELNTLYDHFENTGKEVVEISVEQMMAFAGNMLEVVNLRGEHLLIASEQAYQALTSAQIVQLEQFVRFVYADIDTIETYGGGSARCMIAEIFLPKRKEKSGQ